MPLSSLSERVALSDKLCRLKPAIAEFVTTEFFQRHPDWVTRYGERGRKLGVEDACLHVEFLAGALEAGSPTPFEDYVRWTVRVLAARNIAAHFVSENLEQIQSSLALHLTAAEAQYLAGFTEAGRLACSELSAVTASSEIKTGLALASSLFLQAILKNQRKAAVTIVLEAIQGGHPPTDIYLEVIQESLYEIGRLWESNRITVAEEHMATAITQFVIAQVYPHLPPATKKRGSMVIAGVAGELHQVGANMIADVLDSEGYDVRFLGTNMPHSGIIQAIEEHKADVLGISATMLFNIPHVIKLIEEVREKLGKRCPRIVLGGAAFRSLPSLPAELGVVGFASDIRSAIRMLC